MKWVQLPLTSYFPPWSVTIWHAHPSFDCSISLPTDHLKRTNSNSATKKIRLTSVTNSQEVAHKNWVARCSPGTPEFSCNILHNFNSFNHSYYQSSHYKDFSLPAPLSSLILQINYFKFPCILACSYEFRAIEVLPHNQHLNLDINEENLSKPGFKQRNFNLTTLPHFPTPPLVNIRNRHIKYWSQPASSFLWLTMNKMMWFQPVLGYNVPFSENLST